MLMNRFTLLVFFSALFCTTCFGQNIVINEVVTSNATGYQDEHGENYDWIEIYNGEDSAVNLNGYYLSDDQLNPYEWQFGDITIGSKGYLVVWASGEDIIASSLSPDSLPSLQCWFSASKVDTANSEQVTYVGGQNRVSVWNSTDNNYTAKQTTDAKKPTYISDGINGKPVIRFDGSNVLISDLMPPTGGDPRTFFVIEGNANLDSANLNKNNHILHYGAYGMGEAYGIIIRDKANNYIIGNHYWQQFFYSTKSMDKGSHLISTVYKNGIDDFFVDGSAVGSSYGELNTVGSNTMRIGSRIGNGSELFAGDIAELIVCDDALSNEDRSRVENYLAIKYGMPTHGFHTSFKLNSSGETLTLSDPKGNLVHRIVVPEMPTDVSYGHIGDGTALFAKPTPGAKNDTPAFTGLMTKPNFSVDQGFYLTTQTLTLTNSDPEAVILYTLDGSDPDTSALNGFDFSVKYDYEVTDRSNLQTRSSKTFIYKAPILIEQKINVPNDRSDIPAAIKLWDPASSDVTKATIVKAASWKPNAMKSEIITKTYFVDPDAKTRFNLPVVSIITPDYNLFDYDTGMYVPGAYYDATSSLATPIANFNQSTWERGANIELFDREGVLLYKQGAGIRIHGNYSANWKRKSFRVEAHSEYAASTFKYEIFPGLKSYEAVGGKTIDEFNSFLIRNSGNNWDDNLYHDAMVHRLVDHLGVDGQASRAIVHFLNGEYWGIMNLREKQDASYFSNHYDMKENDVIIINARTMGVSEGADHEYEDYNDVERFVDANLLTDSANYAYINTKIDIDNYLMHFLVEIYIDNTDFLGNNRKMWKKRTSAYKPDAKLGHDGRWRWLLYDTDQSFVHPENDRLTPTTTDDLLSNRILRRLLDVDTVKNGFINSFCDQMNSTFLPERVVHVIDSMQNEMDYEMGYHVDRWNCPNRSTCIARDQEVGERLAFARKRPHYMREHLKSRFVLDDTCTVTIDILGSYGSVQLNSLIINKHLIGIQDVSKVFPWNGVYFRNIPLTAIALPDPGYEFVTWNNGSTNDTITVIAAGDTTLIATFKKKSAELDDIVINEVNYESVGISEAGTWFELCNRTDNSYVLDGYVIGDGLGNNITISGGVKIDPKGYYVFATDLSKFVNYYPEVENVIGLTTNKLIASGKITLSTPTGTIINLVDASSIQTGVTVTDSTTFELLSPDSAVSVPVNWHTSYCKAGTPGDINSVPAYAIVINEFMASNSMTIAAADGKYSDWIELYNPLDVPVDIAGMYLTDNSKNKDLHLIPLGNSDSTMIAPKGFMLLWADGDTDQGVRHLDFKLSANGETIGMYGLGAKKEIDIIDFAKQPLDISYGLVKDGASTWMFFEKPTPNASNNIVDAVSDYSLDKQNVVVYPNPTSGVITIVSKQANRIEIYSLLGNLVWGNTITDALTRVDVKPFGTGIYFVKVYLNDKTITQKISVL